MRRILPILFGLVSPVLFGSVAPALSNPVETASVRNAIGITDLHSGDAKAAEANFREAIDLATPALGDSHPDVAVYQANLAVALWVEHQYGRAEILLRRARYILESSVPPQNERLATILAEISAVETVEKQFARAESDAGESLALIERLSPPDNLAVAVEQVVLSTVYVRERKIAEAEKILPDAVATERHLLADPTSDRRILAHGLRILADLRALQQNWREAQALYAEVIGIYESTSGVNDPSLAPILLKYAEILKHSGVPKEQVRSVEARAKAIRTAKA